MNSDLTTGIARILKADNTTAGTGFVVSADGLLVTCAHVVESAGAKPGDSVALVFHATGESHQARVEPAWWRDPKAEDISLLRLEGVLPPGVTALPLDHPDSSREHCFETFGFPEVSPEEGVWGAGKVLGMTTVKSVPMVQLRSPEITSGFSGAPVWDRDTQRVIGMVISIAAPDRYGRQQETAFAIPSDLLVQVCPQIALVLQPSVNLAVNVYVSSACPDLVEYRDRVVERLHQKRYAVFPRREYAAIEGSSPDGRLYEIACCQIYVAFLASGCDREPRDAELAVIKMEYRQAVESGLECFLFFSGTDLTVGRNATDKGASAKTMGLPWAELATPRAAKFFASPEDLVEQAVALVDSWASSRLDANMHQLRVRRDEADKKRRATRDRQRVVNLRPLDVTHTFKDRLHEMRALCEHLGENSVRLVSVVGRGGMGKTALVSRALTDLERGMLPVPSRARELVVDGIIYLSARSTGLALERIYADVGRMMGEPVNSRLLTYWANKDVSLAAKVEFLLETMQGGLYLILLDNLEDYLAEDGRITSEGLHLFVEGCLTQPSGARLLVTSREEIRIVAAALHRTRCIPLREGLPADDAIALLRELDPQGELGLRDSPEEDLRRAARLTRGIPRALELLAGILYEDPSASLARLLADEISFGTEVVEQLVAEAHRRLGKDEHRVMEALAIFDRPVSETAVAYLLHPWFPGLNAGACLRHLTRSYFVSASRVSGEYSLHPLDAEHSRRQLSDLERDIYCRRNLELRAADFYLSIRKDESEWRSIDDLTPQQAEFEHRVRAGCPDDGARILMSVSDHFHLWGHYYPVKAMCEQLLGKVSDVGLEAATLEILGRMYHSVGNPEDAISNLEKAKALAIQSGDQLILCNTAYRIGIVVRNLGQPEESIEHFQQALAIAREIGSPLLKGRILEELGVAYRDTGQLETGVTCLQEALAIAKGISDQKLEVDALTNLGFSFLLQEQPSEAMEALWSALKTARSIGYRRFEGWSLEFLSRCYLSLGEATKAIAHLQEALDVHHEIGNKNGERQAYDGLGEVCLKMGDLEGAKKHFETALSLDRAIRHRREERRHMAVLETIYSDLGQYRESKDSV